MAYEQLISVPSSATSGQVAKANGSGGYAWSSLDYAASTHASTHATGGADAIAPSDIGAVASSALGAASGVATLDANSKVSAGQVTAHNVLINDSKTLAASDIGKFLIVYSSSDVTITVPNHADVDLVTDEAELEILRWGSGAVYIAPATNVGLWISGDSSGSATRSISSENGVVGLKFIQTNTGGADNWLITGDVE